KWLRPLLLPEPPGWVLYMSEKHSHCVKRALPPRYWRGCTPSILPLTPRWHIILIWASQALKSKQSPKLRAQLGCLPESISKETPDYPVTEPSPKFGMLFAAGRPNFNNLVLFASWGSSPTSPSQMTRWANRQSMNNFATTTKR